MSPGAFVAEGRGFGLWSCKAFSGGEAAKKHVLVSLASEAGCATLPQPSVSLNPSPQADPRLPLKPESPKT